ncbi:MAG: PEP-CTERM sorting domain-containing protein [Armatimonadota bacterium]
MLDNPASYGGVPEPGTFVSLGALCTGTLGLLIRRRRV